MQGHDPTTCKHNETALEVGDLRHPTELNGADEMSSSAGFKRKGLKCKHENCGKEFSLFLGFLSIPKELSDPFEIRCPHCDKKATYSKADIRPLLSVG
jgi:DNA-directed RNA polymerase subunit RPC12/RpoP